MRGKNKKVRKLRAYRDKMLLRIGALEARIRSDEEIFKEVTRCIRTQNYLRIAALVSGDRSFYEGSLDALRIDKVIQELSLVYRMLNIERSYTKEIQRAATNRDYLRVAALCSDHTASSEMHQKVLGAWSQHGFIKQLRKEKDYE